MKIVLGLDACLSAGQTDPVVLAWAVGISVVADRCAVAVGADLELGKGIEWFALTQENISFLCSES